MIHKHPLVGIIFWIVLGFSSGWWVNTIYTNQTPSTVVVARPVALEQAIDSAQLEQTPDYQQALDDYRDAQKNQRLEEVVASREKILDQAEQLLDTDSNQAERLIDAFLEVESYDPGAMFLKARAAFLKGDYPEALDIILELKSIPQADVSLKEIDSLIDNIASTYAASLEKLEQTEALLSLYRRLTQAVPENRGYYYKLAEVQYHLSLYYDAVASLNYSLYDPVWGKRSQQLLEKAQQYINLEDGAQISLERSNDHFIVNAQINYINGVRLLIDTGASLSALRPEVAARLGITYGDDDTNIVHGVNSVFNAPLVIIESLAIQDVEVNNLGLHIVEMGPGIDVDGLLGMNFMRQFRFFIDQERELLFLGSK